MNEKVYERVKSGERMLVLFRNHYRIEFFKLANKYYILINNYHGPSVEDPEECSLDECPINFILKNQTRNIYQINYNKLLNLKNGEFYKTSCHNLILLDGKVYDISETELNNGEISLDNLIEIHDLEKFFINDEMDYNYNEKLKKFMEENTFPPK